ncbi:MAG: hypothetical protein Kow00120_02110 [Anaerolineae bacterium]
MARLIFLLLFAIYLLTFSGQIHSGDEIAILAVTDSLLARGSFDTNLNIWGRYGQPYPAGVPDHFGPSGDLYTKKGIAQSLAPAPFFALGGVFPALGRVHLAALTHGLVTALTGALIYMIARRLGCREVSALAAALLFGLATPAWVYARYHFGEPLIGLALALWFYALLRLPASVSPTPWLALSGFAAGLAVAVNLTNALLVPLLLPATYIALRGRLSVRHWITLGAPLAVIGLGLAALNVLRFGAPFNAGQNPQLGEGFTTPLWFGVYGLLLSPARGLLVHSPSVLIGVAGWFGLRRRHAPLAWLSAGVVAIYLVAFGTYFAWWAGYNWGPRYLLPLVVPAAIAAAPAFDWLLGARGRVRAAAAVAVASLLGVSLLIQALGVAVPFGDYEVALTEQYGFDNTPPILYQYGEAVLNDWSLSPVVGHARLLAEGGVTDISWFTRDGIDWAAALPLAAFVALLAALLVRRARRRSIGGQALAALAALAVALAGWALVRNAAHPLDPYNAPAPALDAVAMEAAQADGSQSAGAFIYVPEYTRSILDRYPGFPAAWGMPPLVAPDADLEAALATAQARHDWLWVVSWFDALSPDAWAEARLAAAHYALPPRAQVGGFWIGRYATRQADEAWQPVGWAFDAGMALEAAAAAPEAPAPGDTLRIALRWQAARAIDGDYVIFVHLVDEDGTVIASADHAPQNAFRPTWGWEAGETVVDRTALPMPGSLARGQDYAVRIGLYDWRTPQARLVGRTATGEVTDSWEVMRFPLP